MSFRDHLINDLDKAFFVLKPNGFADSVSFTPEGGLEIPDIPALFDFSENQKEDSRGNHAVATIALKISDVGLPKKGDTVTLSGVVYEIVRILGRDDMVVKVLARSDLRGSY